MIDPYGTLDQFASFANLRHPAAIPWPTPEPNQPLLSSTIQFLKSAELLLHVRVPFTTNSIYSFVPPVPCDISLTTS